MLNIRLPNDLAIPFFDVEMSMSVSPKVKYKNVYSSFLHNSSDLETTQMSVSRRMNKYPVICSYDGIL